MIQNGIGRKTFYSAIERQCHVLNAFPASRPQMERVLIGSLSPLMFQDKITISLAILISAHMAKETRQGNIFAEPVTECPPILLLYNSSIQKQ